MRDQVSGCSFSRVGLLVLLLLGPGGCGGDDDGDQKSTPVGDLATECARYCDHQGGCPNDSTPASCRNGCEGVGEMFPACVEKWNALNHCMAEHPLVCDAAGYSATMACVSLADAYGACFIGGG